MIFSKESIEKIISGHKTMTRRLKKGRYKVGNEYSVQLGRGKSAIWYCPECGEYQEVNYDDYESELGHYCDNCDEANCPDLKIKILSIKKEKLLDITMSDSWAEGFNNFNEFLNIFIQLNWNNIPRKYKSGINYDVTEDCLCVADEWNPTVWVISFSKVI